MGNILLALALDRLELHHRSLCVHLDVGPREDVADAPVERRDERALHLHALHHGHHLAARHLIARRDRDGDNHTWGEAANEAAIVPRHPVWNAVHLDQELRSLRGNDRAVGIAAVDDSALVRIEALDLALRGDAIHLHPEQPWTYLADAEAVSVAALAQLDCASDLRLRPRPAAAREGIEARPLQGRLDLADLDRGLDQRHVAVGQRPYLAADLQSVEPGVVDVAGPQVRVIEQLKQEALVGRAVAKHDPRVPQRPPQPRDRLRAVAAPGDQLRDHRVELGGDVVTLSDAGVHA